tara:strand:- start:787 stop:915 length:129 start_codon:yes stop_codon:yes gene_type:complete
MGASQDASSATMFQTANDKSNLSSFSGLNSNPLFGGSQIGNA